MRKIANIGGQILVLTGAMGGGGMGAQVISIRVVLVAPCAYDYAEYYGLNL